MRHDDFIPQVAEVDLLDESNTEDMSECLEDPFDDDYMAEYMNDQAYIAIMRMIAMDSFDKGYTERMLEREVQNND